MSAHGGVNLDLWSWPGSKKTLPKSSRVKRAWIDAEHPELSVRRQCELLELERSTDYYQPCTESRENLELMRSIDRLYLQRPFYGSRRTADELEVNRKRLQRLMRMIGPTDARQLEALLAVLQSGTPIKIDYGVYAHAVDWDVDGRLDLILGDHGKEFDKDLSEEERAWRDDARRQQQDFLKLWSTAFADDRKVLGDQSVRNDEERTAHEARLDADRQELVRLKTLLNRYYEEEQALKPGKQFYGRVWLYLRVAPQ